ncbi:hypothetical protein [Streptomyces vastus]|uniref:hypothetical protein n=1 Tax=Streptomyces vastus TaxID=285451 RepID=UPI0031D9A2A0
MATTRGSLRPAAISAAVGLLFTSQTLVTRAGCWEAADPPDGRCSEVESGEVALATRFA